MWSRLSEDGVRGFPGRPKFTTSPCNNPEKDDSFSTRDHVRTGSGPLMIAGSESRWRVLFHRRGYDDSVQGLMLRSCLIEYVACKPSEAGMLAVRRCVDDQYPWIGRESISLKLRSDHDCSIPKSRSAINPQRPISFFPIYGYCCSRTCRLP